MNKAHGMAAIFCASIMIVNIFLLWCNLSGKFTTVQKETVIQLQEPEYIVEKVGVPKVVTVEVIKEVERLPKTKLTDVEKELIARIVYAEANDQDMIGKRLVVDTILNRIGRKGFADTVFGVIYQSGQYVAPAATYTDDCMKAVEYETYERLDYDVLWFRTGCYHSYGKPAYQHGDHYFNSDMED